MTQSEAMRVAKFNEFRANAMRGDLDPDCVWNCAWQAALASLPRMSEEEIRCLLKSASDEHEEGDPQTFDGQWTRERHLARALIAKFPHIVKG